MTVNLTCRYCNDVIAGDDEDDLVSRVRAHVRAHARDQGREHEVSREQILARLRRQVAKKAS
jgi:hypothetical protein